MADDDGGGDVPSVPAVLSADPELLEGAPAAGPDVLAFERLARDPRVTVDKLERLLAMHERLLAVQARAAFQAAYAQMQPQIPQVNEQGQIVVKGQLRSRFATLEDMHAAIVPVLKEHGFALRHRTEWPIDKPGTIRIVGILSHAQGHSEESIFEAAPDVNEFRTAIQSQASTISYGRRYTTMDLLFIVSRADQAAGPRRPAEARPKVDERPAKDPPKATRTENDPAPPAGFDDWIDNLTAAADTGTDTLRAAWEASRRVYQGYLLRDGPAAWDALKARAALAGRAPAAGRRP